MSLPTPGPCPGAFDEPLITALVAERCPACGARLAAGADWCSLCFADLRPAPTQPVNVGGPAASVPEALPSRREASPQAAGHPPAEPGSGTAVAAAPAADVSAPAVDSSSTIAPSAIARPTWPCSSCSAAVDVDLDACPACGTGFLGALRTSGSGIELPMIGDLGRFGDKSRIVLGAGAGLGIAFFLVIIIALIGH